MRVVLAKLVGWLEIIEAAIAIFSMTVITVLTGIQVFYRYIINDPPIWAQEVTVYFFVWFNLMAIAVVYKRRAHITMDLFVNWMPEAARRICAIAVHVLMFAFLVLMMWLSIRLHLFYGRFVSPMMQIPKNVLTYPLLFTVASMIVTSIHFAIMEIRGEKARAVSMMRDLGHSGDLSRLQ